MDRENVIPVIEAVTALDGSESNDDDDKSDWDRFDRLMQTRLRHDLLDKPEELRLIAAAKREIKAWQKRTSKFGIAKEDAHDITQWLRARKHRTDDGALDQLFGKNYKIILKVSNSYRSWARRLGLELSEIFDTAVLGFVRAITKFNRKKNVRLSTYSVLWMRSEIGRELHGHGRLIHVPYNVDVAAAGAAVALDRFVARHGRQPDDIEHANQLIKEDHARQLRKQEENKRRRKKGFSARSKPLRKLARKEAESRVEQYHATPTPPVSADAAYAEDADPLIDMLTYANEGERSASTRLLRLETCQRVRAAVRELPEIERFVIRHLFLVEKRGSAEPTLRGVGKIVPKHITSHGGRLSRERVRQLREQALRRLRKSLKPYYTKSA